MHRHIYCHTHKATHRGSSSLTSHSETIKFTYSAHKRAQPHTHVRFLDWNHFSAGDSAAPAFWSLWHLWLVGPAPASGGLQGCEDEVAAKRLSHNMQCCVLSNISHAHQWQLHKDWKTDLGQTLHLHLYFELIFQMLFYCFMLRDMCFTSVATAFMLKKKHCSWIVRHKNLQ